MALKRYNGFRLTVWNCLALLWLLAFFAGAIPIASWVYGVSWPNHDQVDMVKLVLVGVLVVPLLPFLPGLARAHRRQKRRLREDVRRAPFEPRFTDPARERRLDNRAPRVD